MLRAPFVLAALALLLAGCATTPAPVGGTNATTTPPSAEATPSAVSTTPSLVIMPGSGAAGTPPDDVPHADCARYVFASPFAFDLNESAAYDALANGTTTLPTRGTPAPAAFGLPEGATLTGAVGLFPNATASRNVFQRPAPYEVAVEGAGEAWNVTLTVDPVQADTNATLRARLVGFFENVTSDVGNASAYADAVLAARQDAAPETTVTLHAPLLDAARLASIAPRFAQGASYLSHDDGYLLGWSRGSVELSALLPQRSMERSYANATVTVRSDTVRLNATAHEASPMAFGTTDAALRANVSALLSQSFPFVRSASWARAYMQVACAAEDAPRGPSVR